MENPEQILMTNQEILIKENIPEEQQKISQIPIENNDVQVEHKENQEIPSHVENSGNNLDQKNTSEEKKEIVEETQFYTIFTNLHHEEKPNKIHEEPAKEIEQKINNDLQLNEEIKKEEEVIEEKIEEKIIVEEKAVDQEILVNEEKVIEEVAPHSPEKLKTPLKKEKTKSAKKEKTITKKEKTPAKSNAKTPIKESKTSEKKEKKEKKQDEEDKEPKKRGRKPNQKKEEIVISARKSRKVDNEEFEKYNNLLNTKRQRSAKK